MSRLSKRIVSFVLVVFMLGSLFTGCSQQTGETTAISADGTTKATEKMSENTTAMAKEKVVLKVWGSQEDQVMLGEMVAAFKAANPTKDYDISFGVVSEADAKAKYLEDPAAAADVFAFPNDQLYELVNAGALYEVTRNKDVIVAANGAPSVEAATVDGKLFAYPMTADNGYFMYYDKSVISAEQAKTLDGMLEAAKAANKKVFMDVSNGWYIASFFLGAGGKLEVMNAKQTSDFNNDRGVLAGEAIKAFTAHPAFLTGDDAVLTGGFGDTIAAGVSGTWNSDAIKSKLGDNFAASKLPTFKLGSEEVQMGSFAGFKLIGVNSLTKVPVDALTLAEWLTNEENQVKRFEVRAMGPSNIKAAGSDAVKANIALSALALQNTFATSQKDVLGTYWGPAEAFGTAMEAKDYKKSVKALLDEMVAQITQ